MFVMKHLSELKKNHFRKSYICSSDNLISNMASGRNTRKAVIGFEKSTSSCLNMLMTECDKKFDFSRWRNEETQFVNL